jgi:hypothetical protein
MAIKRPASFNPKSFLGKMGEGRSIATYHKDQVIFSQGEPAEAVFYIQRGKVRSRSFRSKARKPSSQSWDAATFSARDA